ncbi:DUF4244 domain-containing protein [Kocuria tytonis]|uniref:DUF4244 domain-containing protein n=1 Tax=Kocuria tytonis TaxID=2054280 RepID=A0A495AAE1_9MICC|nr:DUF4244 domain-containing protein [Kocuria tytonis]RKQ37051.1 DUF4244 domain-containing protein [Kocuria tytonis]
MSTTTLPAAPTATHVPAPADDHHDAACARLDAGRPADRAATEFPHEVPDSGPAPKEALQPVVPTDRDDPDLGASTAEYAVIVLAAAAFGGVMAAVLSSDSVSGMLLGIIQKALAV